VIPTVPGYTIEEKRGAGAMGVVYRARRETDGRPVALKTIRPACAPRPADLARFQREIAILQKLEHPHIVRYLESGAAGGLLFLAMDYVEGPSAAERVKQSDPLAPDVVVALGCQLLDALAFAHEKGYVHRDVKPDNLLLRPAAATAAAAEAVELILADFGLARAYQESSLSGLTQSGVGGGTAAFMPPEQVTDFRSARPAADLYGSAATLYYLLTRQQIYEPARSTFELMQRILDLEPLPLRSPTAGPRLPERLGAVLRRALARHPSQRYPDARAMRQELAGAL
jgi:serine/threonine-protein kinase